MTSISVMIMAKDGEGRRQGARQWTEDPSVIEVVLAEKHSAFDDAKGDVILMVDAGARVMTRGWGKRMTEAVLSNPNGITCPACLTANGMTYGGHLDVLVPRGGGAVVLEPRWNREPPADGRVGCAMGGAYAFSSAWHRKFSPHAGIRTRGQVEVTALSLKARLSGGSCVVLRDVVAENGSPESPQETPVDVAYGKMRLAFVAFPPRFATAVPTLLAGSPGLREATAMFMEDFRDIVSERDEFWEACGSSPEEAAKKAGIVFGIDFMAKETG